MKKVLFALFAVAAMVSCSNNEVIELNREQIAFGDTFVDNATKADYSTGKVVEGFKVYGTVTANSNTMQVFNGADVTRDGKADGVAWNCTTTQYWLPSATYNFAAIVDGEAATQNNGLPATINHAVADGADLLYTTATVTVTTDGTATPISGVNGNKVVAFNFTHLLSKLQFTIVNTTDQTYKVTSIKVENVAKNGVYSVADGGTWAAGDAGEVELYFGTADVPAESAGVVASKTHQILPLEQTLNVTITYDIMNGEKKLGEMTKSGSITETFAKNTVYNVTATLSGTAISFSLGTIDEWNTPAVEVTPTL